MTAPPERSSILPSSNASPSVWKSLLICWSWSFALWWETILTILLLISDLLLCVYVCVQITATHTSFLPVRVIWKRTSAAARLPILKLPTLWSFRGWRVTLLQGFCISTRTTLSTGALHQPALLPLMWLREASTQVFGAPPYGCSQKQHPGAARVFERRLQHQWFCCRRRAPFTQSSRLIFGQLLHFLL